MWGFGLLKVYNFNFSPKDKKGCELTVFTPFYYWNLYEKIYVCL